MATKTQTTANLGDLLNFSALDEIRQTEVIEEIGDIVFESAILRLVAELSAEQMEALDQFLETEPEAKVLLSHLVTHHKNFVVLLEEEVKEFRKDASEVFSVAQQNQDKPSS